MTKFFTAYNSLKKIDGSPPEGSCLIAFGKNVLSPYDTTVDSWEPSLELFGGLEEGSYYTYAKKRTSLNAVSFSKYMWHYFMLTQVIGPEFLSPPLETENRSPWYEFLTAPLGFLSASFAVRMVTEFDTYYPAVQARGDSEFHDWYVDLRNTFASAGEDGVVEVLENEAFSANSGPIQLQMELM